VQTTPLFCGSSVNVIVIAAAVSPVCVTARLYRPRNFGSLCIGSVHPNWVPEADPE
jgi:hypothetical protein